MFSRLVQKELLHHLLDFRFVVVFALCALLSALGMYVGGQNHLRQLQQYQVVSEKNRTDIQTSLKGTSLWDLTWRGYRWNRRPEVLSSVAYGMSGNLGQEVHIQYRRPLQFEASLFATDPIHALFGVLDLAFIVKVVLSLCMLLFTHDTVCGEKEGGTLRLYASFPVARSTIALTKLVGSTVAVLVPFVFAFLLAGLVLALSPGLELRGGDWMRMVALMGAFALYLTVFAGFGIWASALTHRRMTAFLGLLGLWTVWLFVIPNLAVDVVQRLVPNQSVYDLDRRSSALREEIRKGREAEEKDYRQRNPVQDWDALPEARRRELLEGQRRISDRWDTQFYTRLIHFQTEWHNEMRRQQNWTMVLSALSPLSAISFVSMDLARTGIVQQERVENALSAYLVYMAEFIREKQAQPSQGRVLTDFSLFTYQDNDPLGGCLSRNALHILDLTLLAILGFAGAYVAILRYDVR